MVYHVYTAHSRPHLLPPLFHPNLLAPHPPSITTPFHHIPPTISSNSVQIRIGSLVVSLSMVSISMVFILKEKVLISTVSGESDDGSSKTGEGSLETVPTGEGAGVTPGLTVKRKYELACVPFNLFLSVLPIHPCRPASPSFTDSPNSPNSADFVGFRRTVSEFVGLRRTSSNFVVLHRARLRRRLRLLLLSPPETRDKA